MAMDAVRNAPLNPAGFVQTTHICQILAVLMPGNAAMALWTNANSVMTVTCATTMDVRFVKKRRCLSVEMDVMDHYASPKIFVRKV